MKDLIKQIYQWKITLMFYFNLGWGELALPIAVIRDIAIVLAFLNILFKINFGWFVDGLICLISFSFFVLLGLILKKSGLSDYATKMGNSINPELKLVRKIAGKLGIVE